MGEADTATEARAKEMKREREVKACILFLEIGKARERRRGGGERNQKWREETSPFYTFVRFMESLFLLLQTGATYLVLVGLI